MLLVGQGSEDEYDVPPCSAQGSSAGHSAPRSPLPHDTGHAGGEFESGSSVDSVAAEPGTSMETVVLESDQAGTFGNYPEQTWFLSCSTRIKTDKDRKL